VALVAAPKTLAHDAGFTPPSQGSEDAEAIHELYLIVGGIALAILVLVEALLVWFVVAARRRRRAGVQGPAQQVHGNTRLELVWVGVPVLIIAGIAAATVVKSQDVEAAAKPGEALVVEVQGHQYYWEFIYPNGAIALDTLRLPVGRPVRLELVAPDVIHSFWVPELAGKRDAIPGRTNVLEFTPRRVGSYGGRCGEFCGIQHARMTVRAEVVAAAEFDAWVERERAAQEDGGAELGRRTYEAACAKCHGLAGEGDIGPPLAGSGTLQSEETLRQLLTEGAYSGAYDTYMPPVARGWPDRQLAALFAYFRETDNLLVLGAGDRTGGDGGQ
jgi:cytochrome c oxidase subunit 2